MPAGYHYYRLENGWPVELGSDEAVSFVVTDESLSASNPSGDLRAFATTLQSLWGLLNPFDGWGVDGVIGTTDDTSTERGLVWGCERPESDHQASQ